METNGEQPKQLRQAIEDTFDLNSLRGLVHDLNIDFEQLEPGPFTTKVVSLIGTATRTGKLERLERLVREAQLDTTPNDRDETPPYQGLNYFDVGDTGRYFGRDQLITDLINRINVEKLNFLMVVGASGSGKSSLVWAGLMPTLQVNSL